VKTALLRALKSVNKLKELSWQIALSIKNVVKAIEAGNQEEAQTLYKASVPVIDSFARKGIIHTNKAARHKKRLNARIRAM